jgi:GNAT superfamily N-acetyltransferase
MKQNFKIPMSIEEFEVCEVPFGWKDEYCDGFAYITPRQHGVMMKMPVERRNVETPAEIKPISEVSHGELSELFYQSFVDSVEYLNRTESEIRRNAAREIRNFFKGKRGIPQIKLSRIAILDFKLVGACLVSKYKFGYKNEIIFVPPNYQRKNIGNALAASVLNNLYELGEKIFWSEHHICNELSANWHRKFGFAEETDIMTARFRLNFYRHEFYRNEKSGNEAKLKELKPLLGDAKRAVERLQKVEDENFQAAWLSWRYDF